MNIQELTQKLTEELYGKETGSVTFVEVAPATALASASGFDVVVLSSDGDTIAYRYSDDSIDTDWSQETFKHILLPVWTAAYKYNGKSFRFVVNGQTGKVQGERPWSAWKIAFAVLLALIVAAAAYYIAEAR